MGEPREALRKSERPEDIPSNRFFLKNIPEYRCVVSLWDKY